MWQVVTMEDRVITIDVYQTYLLFPSVIMQSCYKSYFWVKELRLGCVRVVEFVVIV